MVLASLVFGTRAEGDQWIGRCPSLRVSSVGDTEQKALNAVREATHLWLESCVDRGTLENALFELGFIAIESPFTHDVVRVDDRGYWRLPDYLPPDALAQLIRNRDDAAHAAGVDALDEPEHFHYQPNEPQELHA